MKKRILGIAAATAAVLATTTGVAWALDSTDAQANEPQVAGDATSNATAVFPTNKQNEPTIAVNPVASSNLIAASNDEQLQPPCGPGPVRGSVPGSDCSFVANVGSDGVYTSSDGGSTWTNRGLLPGFSDSGGNLVSDGDPVIVYGPKLVGGGFTYANGARAYYASLASYATGAAKGNQAPELLAVSSSDNDGLTWSDPVVAANGHGYTFNDKEAIWVDRNESSPYFGRVYVSWTQFRGIPGCADPVMLAYSADAGQTWSNPKQLSPAYNCAKGGRQGSTIRTGPNGELYVVWEDSDNAGYKQVIAISTDGGKKFTKRIDVGRVTDIQDPIPGSNFRTDSFASLGVDQGSGEIYVAWAQRSGSNASIVVYRSPDGGLTWGQATALSAGGYAFFQGLDVAPNGRVDVGWQEQTATDPSTYGSGNASIDAYYASFDGASWSSPTKVSSASSDPAVSAQNNLGRQFWGDYNTLVSTNANAWFIYTDSRKGVGCAAVDAYQHGLDGSGPAVDKPAPLTDCPPQFRRQFGNTDVFVSKITITP